MKEQPLAKSVEFRGCTAIIYRHKNRNTSRFEVRYYDVDGARQRLTFATFEDAEEFAEKAVRTISASRANFITLRGVAAYEYQQLLEQIKSTQSKGCCRVCSGRKPTIGR